MLDRLTKLKNELSPTGGGNSDPIMFDYKFWSEALTIVTKQRENAKADMLKLAISDKPGVILKSKLFRLVFSESKPIKVFDLEKMIDILVKKFPKDRLFIREAALKAEVEGSTKKTYKVERNDD
jgi:hypothetical protein